MAFKLPKRLIRLIEDKLDRLFDSVKGKMLGGIGKTLTITYNKDLTLPALYETANRESGGLPDVETVKTLADTTENYLDSLKLQTINKTVKTLEHAAQKGVKEPEEIEKILRDSWVDTTSKLQRLVTTEATGYRNIGLLEGVIRVNSSLNIEDPTVAFITSKDDLVCPECTRLHLMPDGLTPRCWKLSQVAHTYVKKGSPVPSIYELHPHGRCSLITVLPGFGFENGSLKYIEPGWDEYAHQQSR